MSLCWRSTGPTAPINAARAALHNHRTSIPKSKDGAVDALRVLRTARAQAVREQRNALQLLRMTIVAAPDEVRDQVRNLTRMQLIRVVAAWRPDVSNAADPVTAYRVGLKSMARRYLELSDEIDEIDDLITPPVEALAPQLLARLGIEIGIEIAGQMLVTAGDNPARMTSEAGFAMLCGVAPLPASSGMTQRHRLNRGGDRQANRALPLAVVSRIRMDPKTQAHVARKTADGHSNSTSSDAPSATSPARSTTYSTPASNTSPRRPYRRTTPADSSATPAGSAGAVKVQHPTVERP